MPDVEFKTNEYNKEMRRMKRTIVICVGVFLILICFSAYVIRIKNTTNDFGVIQFNQGGLKGRPANDGALNVLEPGHFGGHRKRPKIQDSNGGGGAGGGNGLGQGRGRGRGPMYRVPQTTQPFYDSSQQFLKDKIQNTNDENNAKNRVQNEEDLQSDSLSNLGNKLKELAKKTGLDVNGLLEKLWKLKGNKVSPSRNGHQKGDSKHIPRNRFQDKKRYWYDYNGIKHRVDNGRNYAGFRDGQQVGYANNNRRLHDRYRGDGGDWQRGRMEHNGYNRNHDSNRDRNPSNRRYGQQRNHQPFGELGGNINERLYNYNRHPQGHGKGNNRNQGGGFQDNFPIRGAHNRDEINNQERGKFNNDDRIDKTESSQASHDKNSAMNERHYNNGHTLSDTVNTGDSEEERKGVEPALYKTRNMIKQRIKSLIQEQKSAKHGDKSLYLSIALLQSTLESIESELSANKNNHNETHVSGEADDTIKTTFAQSEVDQIKHYDSQNSTINSTKLDNDAISSTEVTTSSTTEVHKSELVSKALTEKTYISDKDINADDIHLEDWQGKNTRITKIVMQLKDDPTKVDVDDLTTDVPGMFECVLLKSVNPNPIICINNPKLDIPLSRSLKFTGLWESGEVTMFKNVLKSNPSFNVIDLGSTLGVYSITAATLGRTVVAVEPLPMNIAPFHKTVIANRFKPQLITLVKNPITDYRGVAEMIYRPYGNLADARTSHLSLKELKHYTRNVHNLVRTITLDDLRTVIPFKTAVLKIDIQGDEYAAFKVANKFFDQIDVRYIFMHWIPTENQTGSRDIAHFLKERNFKAKTEVHSKYIEDSDLLYDHNVIIWIKQ